MSAELGEEIWIFGALCLYWCDVELHIQPVWFLGIHCLERRFSEMHFLVFLLWVFSGRLVFGERKFSADWFSGREKFSGYEKHW